MKFNGFELLHVCSTHGCFRWGRRGISLLKNACHSPSQKISNGARTRGFFAPPKLYCQVSSSSPTPLSLSCNCCSERLTAYSLQDLPLQLNKVSLTNICCHYVYSCKRRQRKLEFQFFVNHSKITLTQHLVKCTYS